MDEDVVVNNMGRPSKSFLGKDVKTFLTNLKGPTWLNIEGKNQEKTRVISTLLHGNEPSGIRALHRWLHLEKKPATNLLCFIGSVKAALQEPFFSHRMLPGAKDLNRAFFPPFNSPEGKIAEAFLNKVKEDCPEAIVDLHNTTGSSLGFGISTEQIPEVVALTSLFTHKLIITHLNLGSLMEAAEKYAPTITIECGGVKDAQSDGMAFNGLCKFIESTDLFVGNEPEKVLIIHNPYRIELVKDKTIGFALSQVDDWDITFPPDVEKYNYEKLSPGEPLGWIKGDDLSALQMLNLKGENIIHHYFKVDGNKLYSKEPLALYMVTTNPKIAESDCLFYITVLSEQD